MAEPEMEPLKSREFRNADRSHWRSRLASGRARISALFDEVVVRV
ncbi:hypothetical protein DsansV1_C02g0014891 [Dioscorea sansibarensis]